MKKRLLVLLAIMALIIACAAVSASADDQDIRNSFVCPCSTCVEAREADPTYKCPEISAWKSVSTTAKTTFASGGHYYVGTDTTAGGTLSMSAGREVVLLIDNCTLRYQASGRMFAMNGSDDSTDQPMKLHIIGNNEGRLQHKYTGSGTQGAIIQVGAYDTAHLHLYGDLLVECESGSASATSGGLIKLPNKGRLYIHDNEDMGLTNSNDPILNGHSATTGGGVVYMQSGSPVFNMEAGTLNGGATVNGGALLMEAGTFKMTGGIINGSSVTKGGAIYISGGTATVSGGTIAGATMVAGGNGGAIYQAGGTVKLNGGTVAGGVVAKNSEDNGGLGGVIYISSGTMTINGAEIKNGKASSGGNIYVASAGKLNMQSGSISGGHATSVGGAVYVAGKSDGTRGVFNMSGGTVTADGSKSGNSKGIRVQYGELNLSGNAIVVSAGSSETGAGIDALYGLVSLDGNATISTPAGKTAYDIMVREYSGGKLTVKETWEGSATVRFNHMTKAGATNTYAPGGAVSTTYGESTGDFAGVLYLASESTMPRIYGKEGKLVFSDVSVVTADDLTWYKNNAEALNAANGKTDRYVKLFNNTLTMNGETVYVDFNGLATTVAGTGTLYGFDSTASESGGGTASVTASGVTVESFAANPVDGEVFIVITEDGITTFHVIKPVVQSVSLRSSSAGMYYSGKIICDEVVARYITAYGIAMQVGQMPGENFASEALFTKETAAMEVGSEFNGVLVNNIMRADTASNSERAEGVVYANAYVTVQIGDKTLTCLASDNGNAASMSMKALVGKINAVYRTLDEGQKSAISAMYTTFKADMTDGSWRINNIATGAGDDLVAQDEDGLKILMIGNSLSVDAGRMLAYVFAQEGYNNVRVSTLYRSGCKLYQHVDHIEDPANSEYWYTFYNSQYTNAADAIANPASVKPVTSSKKTMLYGIQQDDWDIIVMQQGSSEAALADTYNEDLQTIVDYVLENDSNKETKPTFIWNSIWGYPYNAVELEREEEGKNERDYSSYVTLLKRITGSDTADVATQIKMVDMITQAAKNKIMTNENFAYVIPSGTAFIHGCAALSNDVMYNDYIHASDLGRLMIAYVWYSAITGNEVTQLPDEIPAALLRNGSTNQLLTESEKTVILDCIDKAFKAPYTMPEGFNN